jgi:hypothetical protein
VVVQYENNSVTALGGERAKGPGPGSFGAGRMSVDEKIACGLQLTDECKVLMQAKVDKIDCALFPVHSEEFMSRARAFGLGTVVHHDLDTC